jgi:hypothetical protein
MPSDLCTIDSSGVGVGWQCRYGLWCGAEALETGRLLASVADSSVPVIICASFEECASKRGIKPVPVRRLVNPVSEGSIESIVSVVRAEETSLEGGSPLVPAVCVRWFCFWPVVSCGGLSVGYSEALRLDESAVACCNISECDRAGPHSA